MISYLVSVAAIILAALIIFLVHRGTPRALLLARVAALAASVAMIYLLWRIVTRRPHA